MLTRTEKSFIKSLIGTPTWQVLMQVQATLCDEISYQPKTGEDEWDTLKNVLGQEGQVYGIRRFFQELNKIALHANDDE